MYGSILPVAFVDGPFVPVAFVGGPLSPVAFVDGPLHTGLPVAGEVELSVFLLIGLLGGAHCLGMCGPLVTAYAAQFGTGAEAGSGSTGSPESAGSTGSTDGSPGRTRVSRRDLRQHTLFNLGRAGSYALLGGLFGLAGALAYDSLSVVLALDDAVRASVGVLVGVGIVVTGVRYVAGGAVGHGALSGIPGLSRVAALFGRLQGRLDGYASGPGIVGLGLVHGLLPCPLLYPAYLYAFARGSPLVGVQALGLLGLGTIPTLFAYGTVVGSVGTDTRRRLHRALGVAFVVLGLMPIAHGLALVGVPVPHVELPVYQPLTG